MSTKIILLRGVMPIGKTKVPMAQLREVLEKAGFKNVRTYIASGNALVDSTVSEQAISVRVHTLIKKHIGPDLSVFVRTPQEMEMVRKKNPFPKGKPNQVLVTFFADIVQKNFMDGVVLGDHEEVRVGRREVYVHYPDGAGRTKLKLPKIAYAGTARNMNTIAKLIELSKE